MKVRHCVEKSNVESTSLTIIDPLQVRHAIVNSGKISSLSGSINPQSHLNLDYPVHLVKNCIIANKFELGSKIELSNGGFIFAQVRPDSYQHYGKYDYTQNLLNMIESVKKLRSITSNTNTDTNINTHKINSSSAYASDDVNNNN
jgi:hypothetical protein